MEHVLEKPKITSKTKPKHKFQLCSRMELIDNKEKHGFVAKSSCSVESNTNEQEHSHTMESDTIQQAHTSRPQEVS